MFKNVLKNYRTKNIYSVEKEYLQRSSCVTHETSKWHEILMCPVVRQEPRILRNSTITKHTFNRGFISVGL